MVVDDKWNRDWALYSGDKFITIGTLYEISEYTGISLDSLKIYSRKYHKTHFPNGRSLIRIEDEEEVLE
jgi:hypothetical protein